MRVISVVVLSVTSLNAAAADDWPEVSAEFETEQFQTQQWRLQQEEGSSYYDDRPENSRESSYGSRFGQGYESRINARQRTSGSGDGGR